MIQLETPKISPKIYNMRCPSCAKLYKVDAVQIQSSSPHFDCQVCRTQFTFDYPPRHPHSISTRPLKLASFSKVSGLEFQDAVDQNLTKKCPKCEHFNPRNYSECGKCRVLLARVEGLPLEPKMGALPSLLKMWQDLMSDYDNLTKHVAFVDRCEDLQALPFALKKYQDLREAQPQDELAGKMFQQVWVKALGRRMGQVAEKSKLKLLYNSINWVRVRKLAPVLLGLVFILIGSAQGSLRNLIGMGAALLLLTVGIRFFKAGEIRWNDYL